MMIKVSNPSQLIEALDHNEKSIHITRTMTLAQPIFLPDGIEIKGVRQENGVLPTVFFSHSDGFILKGGATITDLAISALQDKKAISLLPQQSRENFGTVSLNHLEVDGQISLIFRAPTLSAHVETHNVLVRKSDTRTYLEQPQKYGVNVLQGAYTLYNFNPDASSNITASISDLNIGQEGQPVIGSGVFISGFNDAGGKVNIKTMTLGSVFSTGLLPQGVADFITAGVFIVYGAHVHNLHQLGKTVTYGVNDMVLDAWGTVDKWIVEGEVVSYGQSGVGFVNFGTVNYFETKQAISTFGVGARAYNQYDGTLKEGHFVDINTYNDGAVGIQISKEVGELHFNGNITTHGGIGQSLVKGVNVDLPAYAFSIKDGGYLHKLHVHGSIISHGENVTTVTMEQDGRLDNVQIEGTIEATGTNSKSFSDDSIAAIF
ncbi:TPA: hypothetical protein ACGOYQ_000599 [Streptococcus suis]